MSRELNKKQQRLVAIAKNGGGDFLLPLLDAIDELEIKLEALESKLDHSPPLSDEEKIERIAIKLAVKVADVQRGEPGHTPTKDELLALIKPLIPIVRNGIDGHTPTEEELLKLIKPLIPVIQDGKTPTQEELIALIKPLIILPSTESLVEEAEKKLETNLPQLGEPIRDALEFLQGEERLDASAIKGLDEKVTSITSKQVIHGGGGGLPRIHRIDLSSNLNGSTKSFVIGSHLGIISVESDSAPFGAFRFSTDYTSGGKTIEFTDNVEASVALAAGHSLIVTILK